MRRLMAPSIIGLVVLSGGCDWFHSHPSLLDQPPERISVTGSLEARLQCPHDWPVQMPFFDPEQRSNIIVELPLNGPGTRADIVEFHDCQQFHDDSMTSYDSLFAIFAVARLTRLDSLLLAGQGGLGLLASDPDFLNGAEWLPVAEIVAWNAYRTLGIGLGLNCLYVTVAPASSPSRWQAMMFHFGWTAPECSSAVTDAVVRAGRLPTVDPLPPGSTGQFRGTPLTVSESANARLSRQDYPAVARWEWNGRQYYIGFGCPGSWCEVGNSVASAQTHASKMLDAGNVGDLTYSGRLRVLEAKGWYDEQILSERDPGTGLLIPSSVLGTLIPVPELETLNSVSDFRNWTQVAWVSLEDLSGGTRPNTYREKSNLHITGRGAPLDGLNKIYLCAGIGCLCPADAHHCEEGAELVAPQPCLKEHGQPSDGGPWWARIVNPEGRSTIRCVVRYAMPNIPIPGTVRWRWLANDEEEWIRCPEGCCEVLGGEEGG
jgi:hypothetical protein